MNLQGIFSFTILFTLILQNSHAGILSTTQNFAKPTNFLNLKNLNFSFQPYENAAIPCTFFFTPGTNDYDVKCDENHFKIHFFVRPYSNATQSSTEVLMMSQRVSNYLPNVNRSHTNASPSSINMSNSNMNNSSASTSFWIHSSKETKVERMLVSLGVDNDTASLTARFELEP